MTPTRVTHLVRRIRQLTEAAVRLDHQIAVLRDPGRTATDALRCAGPIVSADTVGLPSTPLPDTPPE